MQSRHKKILAIGLVLFVAVGGAVLWQYLRARPSANQILLSGTIEADEIHIGSKIGGRIAEVLVKEGQEVKQGQAILRFEPYDLEARRRDALAAIAVAEANLQKLENGSRPEEIAEARAQTEAARLSLEEARNGPRRQEIAAARAEMDAATADYEVARSSFARIEQLARDGISSRQDYDTAKANLDRAQGRREAARQRLELLLAGTRKEEIARAQRQVQQAVARQQLLERGARQEDIQAARAQVARARATLQQIETQANELEVTSPSDAFIEILQVRPGDLINPNSPVATLVETDRLWVRVYVPEPELGYAQLGKEVSVTVDSFPQEIFKGTLEQISARGEFTPRNVQTRDERVHQVFAVRVRLDNHSKKLRAGMAADVSVGK